jgi:hypothetical protein
MSDLILYTSDDGKSRIQLRAKDQTVWPSQREMSQLFNVSTDNVGLHLKNIFADGEPEENSVTEESSVTATDGKHYQQGEANCQGILDSSCRTENDVNYRGFLGSSKSRTSQSFAAKIP